MSKLNIIIGSTRPTRSADLVAPWVIARAGSHGQFDVEVLDLRDWPLPMFAEHAGTIGDRNDPTYSEPIVKRWNAAMKAADAFVFVTPEYNHSVPGVLKNALDNVFVSYALRNKPSAMISYSTGIAAGVRAIEHLAHMIIEGDGVPLRSTVIIPFVGQAFDDGEPRDPMTEVAMDVMLDDLAWWSRTLERGRADGELDPAGVRTRAAMAARQG
jgi:NAD(P)H-dependent FMN reductase